MIILTASLTTVNDHDNDRDDNNGFQTQFAPLETRLIDVSQTFCDGIEVEDSSRQMPATAYVLTRGPSLTQEHDYVISDTVTISSNSYQFWNYYLHHGSSMNASICIQSGQSVEFYVIQGSKNFQDWEDGEDNFIKFIIVGSACPQRMSTGLEFVDNTDDYFFAYASNGGTVTFETTMNFNRKEFGIEQQNVKDHCNAGGDHSRKCKVSIPYSGKHYFLLATGDTTSTEGDEDGALVSWSCQPRVWVYLLAFLLPALIGIVFVTATCVICCIRQRTHNRSYGRLRDDAASAAAVTSTTAFVTTTTTTAPSSGPAKDLPPPYTPTVAPQAGYTGQAPYPATATYPPPSMPQPTAYPPTTQTYGATDNKPLY